jgi:hypothetical protein
MGKMPKKKPSPPYVLVVPVAKNARKAGNSPYLVVFSGR